jgi:hypothetical protein
MNSANYTDLAQSMLVMYGPAKAFSLANRYAHESTANGDEAGRSKWVMAAALIGRFIDAMERMPTDTRPA